MTSVQPLSAKDEPKGLGGWLILPMISLLAAPLFGLLQPNVLLPFLKAQLSEFQSTLLENIAWPYVVIYFLISILMPICLLILMFRKKKLFPSLYMIWGVVNLVLIVANLGLGAGFFMSSFQQPWLREFFLSGIWHGILYVIGIAYMRNSIRVRSTFIK